jgi:hypothetical protein
MSKTHINTNSEFINKYIKRMTKVMLKLNPEWSEDDIKKIILKMIKEQGENPTVQLDNNYTGESHETTLISVFDWILSRKPLIAGNGTFYKNQNEALNPIRLMLDDWAASRKRFKNQMFVAGEKLGFDSYEYQTLDRKQNNEKINMNSWYGGSGAPTAAFYSKWSGPATTLTAQSVISTAETMFESFLADNYIYLNITELIEWINIVINEDSHIDDFIERKDINDVYNRFIEKILNREDNDEEILFKYLKNFNSEQLTSLYYKNNMIEFIDNHKKIKDIILTIFTSVENLEYVDTKDSDWKDKIPGKYYNEFINKSAKDWNKFVDKQYFMDPNSPPKTVEEELKILCEMLIKYCYVEYLSMDRIYRLKNFNRRVVTVIDTDSNFLSLDTLINYIFDNVIKDSTFNRDAEHNTFIIVNTITYTITHAIRKMFDYYGECSNIPDEYKERFDMKNEFFNSLLVIGNTKKRYISKQKLREGNLLTKPKSDIKGFDFKKATTSEYAESVFMKLIQNHILNSEEIELRDMIRGIQDFRREIRDSIKRGERTFLPNGSAKELGAYKDPGTSQSVRGVITWNLLYPDNSIEFPSKVSLVKMNIFNEEDIEDLKYTHPEIYRIIIDKIFNDTTGIFVTKTKDPGIDYVNIKKKDWYNDIPKKFRTKFKKLGPIAWNTFVDEVVSESNPKYAKLKSDSWIYKKKGLQVLAIPSNSTIPEWAQPYIDYATMINNITAPFEPVLEIFGVKFTEEGKTHNGVNRKTNTITNIIKF